MSPKGSGSSSVGKRNKSQATALSVNVKSNRSPAVDMKEVEDVSTLACVELSRSIMRRPEVNTGSFFKIVSASRNDVNKSDAVLVISAAVLESIGNQRAAKSLLSKSRTVSEFYERMRLDDESMRQSFVIMLFAIAPEFVKMVETSIKMSLERVQDITSAPHANSKIVEAMGELYKSGSVSPTEHQKMLDEAMSMDKTPESADLRFSFTETPPDMIGFEDSASQTGNKSPSLTASAMNTAGLMRYIKRTPAYKKSNFIYDVPTNNQPVVNSMTFNKNRQGLGYNTALSSFDDNMSESQFTTAMNNLLPRPPVKKRYSLTSADKIKFKNPEVESVVDSSEAQSFATASMGLPVNYADYNVTREDISEIKKGKSNRQLGYSTLDTALTEELTDLELLNLL